MISYYIIGGASLAIFLVIQISILRRQIRYYWKAIAATFVWAFCICISLPFAIIRPSSPKNLLFMRQALNRFSPHMGIKYEIRCAHNLPDDEGAILVANHQNYFDIQVSSIIQLLLKPGHNLMVQLSAIPHSQILNYLTGSEWYVGRRTSPNQKLLSRIKEAKQFKIKIWIHSEGTRFFEAAKAKTFLPFKKGAYFVALEAGMPIVPIVISPYYFASQSKLVREGGKVIVEVLPKVVTEGRSVNEVDALIKEVRDSMIEKYLMLREEVLSSLPPEHPIFKWINDTD